MELVVGAPLNTARDFDRLPVGAVIGPPRSRDETYEKRPDGWWSNLYGQYTSLADFTMDGHNVVLSLPKGVKVWESLMQWQFRYRDNAYMSADSAGVSRRTVADALNELGIGDDYFPLGKGVRVGNEYDKGRLPVGTMGQRGEPEHINDFGLFVKNRDGWLQILGDCNGHQNHRLLVLTGDEVEWATKPGTEADQPLLANFKARAWRVGWKVKKRNRWCESYETYMARAGLTEDALTEAVHEGIRVGERVNAEQARTLPVGSILRWSSRVNPETTFSWYVRTDATSNAAGTRAIFGRRRDGGALRNSASVMEVVHIANEDALMDVRVENINDLQDILPIGTRLRSGGTDLVLCHDRKLNPGTAPLREGAWAFEALSDLRITGFPS